MEMSEKFDLITKAFVKAQSSIEGAIKNSQNDHFHNNYADLSAVMDACKPAFTANELAVLQTTGTDENVSSVVIITTILHSSGQWFRARLTMPLEKRSAQAVGSAITYGRRYALAAMVGVAQVDDDAEGASSRGQQQGRQQQGKQQSQSTRQRAERSEPAGTEQQGNECISPDQVKTLREMIEVSGVDEKAFLTWCKSRAIEFIPARKYQPCVDMLNKKIDALNAAETEAA